MTHHSSPAAGRPDPGDSAAPLPVMPVFHERSFTEEDHERIRRANRPHANVPLGEDGEVTNAPLARVFVAPEENPEDMSVKNSAKDNA